MSAVTTGSGYVWRQLVLPVPVDEARVRSFVTALAMLSGSPYVVFEAIGHGGTVVWRLGTEGWAARNVYALALAHLPGVRLVNPGEQPVAGMADVLVSQTVRLDRDDVATAEPSAVAAVRLTGTDSAPLAANAAESITRSLLAVLASAGTKETLRVQLVCGSRLYPRHPARVEAEQLAAGAVRQAVQVLGEPGFLASLRIAASAGTPGRANALVTSAISALKGIQTPRIRLRSWRSSARTVTQARSPWLLALQLHASQIPALLAWPLADDLPGVPTPHPVVLPPSLPLRRVGHREGVRRLGEAVTAPGRALSVTVEDSLRHLHVLGPTGVGKSTLMAQLVLQDIAAGHGVLVVDPKGDLVADIATRVPEEYLDEVVIIDAKDIAPVGINPLVGVADPDLAADVLLGVFRSLYEDAWGPRTNDILHASLLTLARRGDASLVMVPLLLTNPGFRRSVVGREAKRDPLGLGAFWTWFEGISDAERQQVIAPLMNKLRPILLRPSLRAVFGQRQPRFQLSQLFNHEPGQTAPRVVLVNLAKGVVGEEAARLLGSIVVSLAWQAALARAGRPAVQRRPVFIHIDELQDYLRLPGDLGAALAQARGLGVGFTLAHQHLGQLPKHLLAGMVANARSRMAFNLTGDDARRIAALAGGGVQAVDFQSLPAFHAYATLLADGELQPPASLRTVPLGEPLYAYADVAQRSRGRYGQTLNDVEADLADLLDGPPASGDNGEVRIGRSRRSASVSSGEALP